MRQEGQIAPLPDATGHPQFITHQLPEALQVDEVIGFGRPEAGAPQAPAQKN
jgi:hypothetical protein